MATILIVDECAQNRKDFAMPLEHQGHRLLEASDAADALALVRRERPHLVIVDTRVPREDGYEMIRHLEFDRELAQTRLILYSDRDVQDESIALTRGIDVPVVLPKPAGPEEVVRMVNLALSATTGSAKPASSHRRIDRERLRPSTKSGSGIALRRTTVTAENECLRAELIRRTKELNRAVLRRKLAEQTLAELQERKPWAPRATSDIRLQALFDNALDGILLADDKNRFVGANPAACQLLGYSPDELAQMNLLDVTPRENHGLARDSWQRFLAAGKLCGEYTILCKDGTRREVEFRSVANALPGFHLSLMQDITQRKQTERQLRESETWFRQLAENIGEVFWMNDAEQSNAIYVSPAYERIWGRTRDSLYVSPLAWTDAIHAADRDRVIEAAGTMHTKQVYDQTYRIVRPDGSIRWIRDRAFPVHDTSGKLIRMAGIADDITDAKLLQNQRDCLLQRLHLQIERMPLAYILVDAENRIVEWNPAAVKTFGFTRQEALGQVCFELLVPPPPSDQVLGILRRIRAGDMNAHSVSENLTKDGRIITCEWFNTPLIDADGEFTGFICVAQDITDRKRVEKALSETALRSRILSQRVVEAQEDERRRISRELHDEIGQALTATKVNLQMLERTAKDLASAAQDTMLTVDNAMQQTRSLSLDLRPPMLDDLGLGAALRGYLDRQAQRAGFAIDFDIEPIVDRVSPEVETACFRVAQEAMTNIVRHARPNHVIVELRQRDADLQLRIRDDGVGFIVAVARVRAGRGESLGLLGMEERVSLLGGQIGIQSKPNEGTEVLVRFPIHAAN